MPMDSVLPLVAKSWCPIGWRGNRCLRLSVGPVTIPALLDAEIAVETFHSAPIITDSR